MANAKSLSPKHGSTTKPYAKMLVADEFRSEQSGKVMAIGLYSDGVVVLTVPKNAPKATKETPYGIDRLALLLTVGGFEGATTVKFGIEGGRVLEHNVSLLSGNSANIILNLKPFRTITFGMKKILMEFAGTKHVLQFEVRANWIDPVTNLDDYIDVIPTVVKLPAPKPIKPKTAAKKAPTKKRAS